MTIDARQSLTSSGYYPYDAPNYWWDRVIDHGVRSDVGDPPDPLDWAHAAARGIILYAQNRDEGVIASAFDELGDQERSDTVHAIADIIRLAAQDRGLSAPHSGGAAGRPERTEEDL